MPAGNWRVREQASELLSAPSPLTLNGKRDRAMLVLLLGCGLLPTELLALTVDQIEHAQGPLGLVGRQRQPPAYRVPAAVKHQVEE